MKNFLTFFFLVISIILSSFTFSSSSSSSSSSSISSKRYLILHLQRLGLANRLRSISDWYSISLQSKRHLLISWEPSFDCNISFFDLFQEGISSFSILEDPLPFGEEGKLLVQKISLESNLTFTSIQPLNDFFYYEQEKEVLFDLNIDIVYTNHDGAVVLPDTSCQNHLLFRSKFYQLLKPTNEIQQTINQILEHFQNRVMIGVHIRIHDPLFDWEIVPPAPGQDVATLFGVATTLEHFKIQLDSIEKTFKIKNNNLLPRFYITSNDIDTKKRILRYYPDAISVYSAGDIGRNTRDGMILSLVEWFLLSKCDLIINTLGSSYALEASLVNRIPLVSLWSGSAIYQLDIRLPHCGSLPYLKEFINGKEVKYEEGTSDRRQVNAEVISLAPCPLLSEWGFINLFCIWNRN